jgi:hypothetical protein
LIGFDGSLIGRSRHLPKVQTPQTAQCTLYQSVTAKSARHISWISVTDWLRVYHPAILRSNTHTMLPGLIERMIRALPRPLHMYSVSVLALREIISKIYITHTYDGGSSRTSAFGKDASHLVPLMIPGAHRDLTKLLMNINLAIQNLLYFWQTKYFCQVK